MENKKHFIYINIPFLILTPIIIIQLYSYILLAPYFRAALNYPGELTYGEAGLLRANVFLDRGLPIYQDLLADYNNQVLMYPPVYTFIAAPFYRLVPMSFFSGRLVSSLFAFFSAAVLYKILIFYTKNRLISFISSSVLPILYPIVEFGYNYRVDTTALFFSLMAFYAFLKTKNPYLSIPFILLILFTKPTFLAVPITINIFLIMRKEYRHLFYFNSFIFLTSVSFIVVLEKVFAGNFLKSVIISNAVGAYDWSLLKGTHLHLWFMYAIFICGIIVYFHARGGIENLKLLLVYTLVSLLLTVSVVKRGSGINYFLEFSSALLILLGLTIRKLPSLLESKRFFLSGVLLVLVAMFFFHNTEKIQAKNKISPFLHGDDIREMLDILSKTDKKILTESSAYPVLLDKKDYYVFATFRLLNNSHNEMYERVLENIKNKEYAYIVLKTPAANRELYEEVFHTKGDAKEDERIGIRMVEALEGNYQVVFVNSTIGGVLIPKN